MSLEPDGHPRRDVAAGDAFVLPSHVTVGIHALFDDLEMLEVALPAGFATAVARAPPGPTIDAPSGPQCRLKPAFQAVAPSVTAPRG